MANETLSRLKVGAGGSTSQKVIQKNMTADRFKVSQDGSQIAYVDEDGDIKVLNLRKENTYSVKAPENEELIPVGFIGNDLCYGLMRSGDIGEMVDGREVHPIYRIVLCNRDKDNLMTYEKKGVLMREARVEDGTVILERIQKSRGTYVDVADDYIQSNAAGKAGNIEKERMTTDDGIEQIHLTYANGVTGKKPHYLTPKQSFSTEKIPVRVSKNNYHNRYYIFGYGRAAGGEDLPGDAILKADKLSGVVTLGAQGIYWERGNRDIIYDIPNITFFKAGKGQSPREAAEKHMLSYCKATKSVDLSECTIEQLLYLINHRKPVVALTKGNNALLIYGYSETSIHCVDAKTGKALKLTYEEFEGKARAYLSADPMSIQ